MVADDGANGEGVGGQNKLDGAGTWQPMRKDATRPVGKPSLYGYLRVGVDRRSCSLRCVCFPVPNRVCSRLTGTTP